MARANECEDEFSIMHDVWKQGLRDQVEKDLEHQVRLRLNVDRLCHYCEETLPPRPIIYHQLFHLHRPTSINLQHNMMNKNTLYSIQSPCSERHTEIPKVNCVERCFRSLDKCDGQLQSKLIIDKQKGQKYKSKWKQNITSIEEQQKHSRKQTIHANSDVTILSGIMDYVHSKYGTPKAQLKKLSKMGCYETNAIDTSGVGTGPTIKCPIESHICLSTPNLEHYSRHQSSKIISQQEARGHHVCAARQMVSASADSSRSRLIYSSEQEIIVTKNLEFESKFESGNLQQAYELTSQEYILWLSPDLYSKRNTQWYYFRLRGMAAKKPYTFHIVNFLKPDSLYNYGMQPLMYSEKAVECGLNGWSRVGYNISYHKSSVNHVSSELQGSTYYTLTWTMEFPYFDDTCYMAHCFPYPYSQLLTYLSKLEECPQRSCYITNDNLCYTLAGNCCPVLTITNFNCTTDKPEKRHRMGVVITARVHPGETNSSWMMQGLIDFLTSDNDHAKSLRSHYVFKLVPMLNPDGVIVGNYRTSLAGVDLNRVYKSPQANLFPTVYHTKKLIEQVKTERKLLLYVDLHGHSRRHNVFMYGCHTPHCDHLRLLDERVIPFLLSKQAPQVFDYASCKFNVQRNKEATGRVTTWRMGVPNSFTMESTFCGSTLTDTMHQFSKEDLMEIGKRLAESIYCYCHYLQSESYQCKIRSQIAEIMTKSQIGRRSSNVSTAEVKLPELTRSKRDEKMPLCLSLKEQEGHCTSKILNNFMKMDLSLLENESSTSGSDSENDDFSWKTKKGRNKKSVFPRQAKTQINLPCLVKSIKRIKAPQPHGECDYDIAKAIHSAPARLFQDTMGKNSSRMLHLPPSWKFVNKYQTRSNGGIPIFSEERLKERKEKKLLQSQSFNLHLPLDSNTKVCLSKSLSKKAVDQKLKSAAQNELCKMPTSIHLPSSYQLKSKIVGTNIHLKLSPELAKYISDIWKA